MQLAFLTNYYFGFSLIFLHLLIHSMGSFAVDLAMKRSSIYRHSLKEEKNLKAKDLVEMLRILKAAASIR